MSRGVWHRRLRHDDYQHDLGLLCCGAALEMAWVDRLYRTRFPIVASNSMKLGQGRWFALAIAIASFTTLTTWKRGRALLLEAIAQESPSLSEFLRFKEPRALRVANTAVFLTSRPEGLPSSLLHNLKHNQVLHERNVLVTVVTEEIPHVKDQDRVELTDLGKELCAEVGDGVKG